MPFFDAFIVSSANMKIRTIDAVGLEYRVPADRAYGSAVELVARRQATLIRVSTEEGIEGIGDARADGDFGR